MFLELAISWLLFPLLSLAVFLGCGLLLERIIRQDLPAVLIPPLGLAVVVVASQFATNWALGFNLATPLVVALALTGLVLSRNRLRGLKIEWPLALAPLVVFALYAAPIVLSGQATFAGYYLNSEPAIHFIGIDHAVEHARNIAFLAPSSYEYCLSDFYGHGYPLGSQTALGSLRPLLGQDVAWLFQPYIALLMAMAASALWFLVNQVVKNRWQCGVITFVAAQPALVYAYAMQGSLKEVAAVWAVLLTAACLSWLVANGRSLRAVLPLAVVVAAGLEVISVAILPWLALILATGFVWLLKERGKSGRKFVLRQVIFFALATLVLSYPALSVLGSLIEISKGQLTTQNELTAAFGLGNLLTPLNNLQIFGVWLSGDHRVAAEGLLLNWTYLLIGVTVTSSLVGLVWLLRRRSWSLLLYLISSVIACIFVVSKGSPWADAKALMITSPAILTVAMLGAVALYRSRLRSAGLLIGAAILAGVLWSNGLIYHNVNLAPRDRLEDLELIGKQIAGQGPALYVEFEEYGKHFLRRADPEGRSEGCQRRFELLRGGSSPLQGYSYDLDQLKLRHLLQYRTIVLRRSPTASRPPASYRKILTTKYYQVWQRRQTPKPQIVAHLPLGAEHQPSSPPQCSLIEKLADRARAVGGRLAYVQRRQSLVVVPAKETLPASWSLDPSEANTVIPSGQGTVKSSVEVERPGSYRVWLGGSFGRGHTVLIDGKKIGSISYQLNGRGQFAQIATIKLERGTHTVTVSTPGGDLRPGNGGKIRQLGPVILSPPSAGQPVVKYLDPDRFKDLCKLDLDWVEVVK